MNKYCIGIAMFLAGCAAGFAASQIAKCRRCGRNAEVDLCDCDCDEFENEGEAIPGSAEKTEAAVLSEEERAKDTGKTECSGDDDFGN